MSDYEERKKRDRSPAFPYVSLEIAVDRLSKLFEQYGKHAARIGNIAPFWDLSPNSSTPLRTVAALKLFGLVEISGSGAERKVTISMLGNRILNDNRKDAKSNALKEAFSNCEILEKYFERWTDKRPPDEECISELTIDGNFTKQAARKFIGVYDDSVEYASLVSSVRPNDGFRHEDELKDDSAEDNSADMDNSSTKEQSLVSSDSRGIEMRQDTFSLETGDVVIQWPIEITKESYEDFVDWMEILKRKVGRCVKQDSGYDGQPSPEK